MHIVPPLDRQLEPLLRASLDAKAKPVGALGTIEDLAVKIGLVTRSERPSLGRAAVIVAAGDHGIVAEGVAAYPATISRQIAQMVLEGGAGANVTARAANAKVFVVDAGLRAPLSPHPQLVEMRGGQGTRNFLRESAMTQDEALDALQGGVNLASDLKERGFGLVALGEIGIGNSSSAALIAHAVTGIDLAKLVGPGAGAPPGGLSHKLDVLTRAYARRPTRNPSEALREFGGFEIMVLIGLMLGGARAGLVMLVDGFIATAAACGGVALDPHLRDYLLFAHLSPEPGHKRLLDWLQAKPLLDLGMRLGEGTGAALAIPLVRAAEGLLRDMADLPGKHPS